MILDENEICPYCDCEGIDHDLTGYDIHPNCPHTSDCADYEYLGDDDDDIDFNDDFDDDEF